MNVVVVCGSRIKNTLKDFVENKSADIKILDIITTVESDFCERISNYYNPHTLVFVRGAKIKGKGTELDALAQLHTLRKDIRIVYVYGNVVNQHDFDETEIILNKMNITGVLSGKITKSNIQNCLLDIPETAVEQTYDVPKENVNVLDLLGITQEDIDNADTDMFGIEKIKQDAENIKNIIAADVAIAKTPEFIQSGELDMFGIEREKAERAKRKEIEIADAAIMTPEYVEANGELDMFGIEHMNKESKPVTEDGANINLEINKKNVILEPSKISETINPLSQIQGKATNEAFSALSSTDNADVSLNKRFNDVWNSAELSANIYSVERVVEKERIVKSIIGNVTIAVAELLSRTGCTNTAIQICSYFSQNDDVALVITDDVTYTNLADWYNIDLSSCINGYLLFGFTIYNNDNYYNAIGKHKTVIIDFGKLTEDNTAEFERSNIKVVMVDASPWNVQMLEKYIQQNNDKPFLSDINFLFNLISKKAYLEFSKQWKKRNLKMYRNCTSDIPFELCEDNKAAFDNIFSGFLKTKKRTFFKK